MKTIPLFAVHMPQSVDEPLLETLHSGFITQGPRVEEFERLLVPWVGTENILTVNTGTTALHLALKLAEVGPEDEVISTPMTCAATNLPVYHTGARIVWADINPRTGNIDPESVRKRVTKRTKAIVCVHWGGYPCDMDEISAVAEEYGLKVIEDAAHAFGAMYRGRMIGSISDFTCFSLQAIKHITTVDGGLIACKDRRDYERAKLLRWYGYDRERTDVERFEQDLAEAGYKWHMNDVAATIGIEQLKLAPTVLRKQRANAAFYRRELADRGIKTVESLAYEDDRVSSDWLFTLLTDRRDKFMTHMMKAGVQISQVHRRNDLHSCLRDFKRDDLPGVNEFTARQCVVPVHWALTEDDRGWIMDRIEEFDSAYRLTEVMV